MRSVDGDCGLKQVSAAEVNVEAVEAQVRP